MNDAKKELLAIIDEIAETQKDIAELEAKRRKMCEEVDKELNEEYSELNTLYEKKRVIENAVIEAIMKE